jgi:hypothetical protein
MIPISRRQVLKATASSATALPAAQRIDGNETQARIYARLPAPAEAKSVRIELILRWTESDHLLLETSTSLRELHREKNRC